MYRTVPHKDVSVIGIYLSTPPCFSHVCMYVQYPVSVSRTNKQTTAKLVCKYIVACHCKIRLQSRARPGNILEWRILDGVMVNVFCAILKKHSNFCSENNSNEMQQLRFILRKCFTLHVSDDNPTHHQEYMCCIWPQVSRHT